MFLIYWIILFFGIIYLLLKYQFSYWARNGFPSLEPEIPYGNMKRFAKKQECIPISTWKMYQNSENPFVGVYIFFCPTLMIRDADLVHKILVTDFEYFYDRNVFINETKEPISVSLFSQKGLKWKQLRQKMTPLFTSGKLKNMFSTLMNEADKLDSYVANKASNTKVIEFSDILKKYVLNVIGSVVFGNDIDTFANPKHPFRKMSEEINSRKFIENLRRALFFLAPKLLNFIPTSAFNPIVRNYFFDLVHETITSRETKNESRNDFMQLMINLKKSDVGLTIKEIAGNGLLFYSAGTESTSSIAEYCLYELALNQVLQHRLQEEIDEVLKMYNGEITYDAIQEMKFLDMCVKETLRKYPGLPMLSRECTKDYKIPNSDLVIKKGTSIMIPVLGLHYDEKYFENPYKFDPERFRKGFETYHKDAYLPFGDGPRKCIAYRMGFMGAKAAIVKMMSKYNFKTVNHEVIAFNEHSFNLKPKNGIRLSVSKR